ncbi:MAG TPA: DUF2809 domain-containing protein [Flavobacterium sp.]
MHFNQKYFIATLVLFLTEVAIALFVNDSFFRPYFGDVLVVILIYCFIRSFFRTNVRRTALGVLLFAFVIEGLQYYRFIELIGLEKIKLARVVIGTSFAWHDIVAYIAGIIIILGVEEFHRKNLINKKK